VRKAAAEATITGVSRSSESTIATDIKPTGLSAKLLITAVALAA
jgi:hypothetical protein